MRKLGYTLLVIGFVWVAFVAVEIGPYARALSVIHHEKISDQQTYTGKELAIAYTEAAYKVAHFAQMSLVGGLSMLAGSVILARGSRQASTTPKPN